MQHLNEHVIPLKTYFIVYLSLMVLLVVTVAVAFNNFGPFNLTIALSVAVVKTILIVLYFMHMKYSPKIVWIYAGAGFFWLFLLVLFTMGDYVSRGWVPSIN